MPRGGARVGAGRKPKLGRDWSRVPLVTDEAFEQACDAAAVVLGCASRADYLRRALSDQLVALAMGEPLQAPPPLLPVPAGDRRRPFGLRLRATVREAAEQAATAGEWSLSKLVRAAAFRLAQRSGTWQPAPTAEQPAAVEVG